jgi:hypothetical protein
MARPTITQRVARAATGAVSMSRPSGNTISAGNGIRPQLDVLLNPNGTTTYTAPTRLGVEPPTTAAAAAVTTTAAAAEIPIIPGAILETEEDVEFEEAEELYLSLGEVRTLFASRIRNIDESGFIVNSPVLFQSSLRTQALFAFTTSNRRMSIVQTIFSADLFDDGDLSRDAVISDYATLYDGADVSISQMNGSVSYDESEKAGLEMKFWRINSTNAVYRNLLNTEFAFSNSVEPPVAQMTNPEQITIDLFSSLSETAESNNEIETSGVPEGFESFTPTPRSPATTSGTGPGSYS